MKRRDGLALGLVSFTALFTELLVIRWEASEIPVLAYFKNFPLLAVFIGLGAGCLLARRGARVWVSSLWAFALLAGLVSQADRLGLSLLVFPETRLDVWNRTFDATGARAVIASAGNLARIFGLLILNAWAFVGPGQAIGRWLLALPPLTGYTIDIAGSLAGVIGFAACSWWQTPPPVWLAVSLVGLLATSALVDRLRWSLPPLACVAAIAFSGAGRAPEPDSFVTWSPYYRIEVSRSLVMPGPPPVTLVYRLDVNRDFHQVMVDTSPGREWFYRLAPAGPRYWELWRSQYGFPYLFKPAPGSMLIGGAGSGNNAAAAVRQRVGRITAVEIDPGIAAIGTALHPLHPYQSNRVTLVRADVRSFVRRTRDTFDLIEYGILDSHTALSSLSSLRLENYVYTVEGLRDAVRRLTPDGVMVVSFHDGGRPWLGRRLRRNITLATGAPPVGTRLDTMAFFVFGPGAPAAKAAEILRRHGYPVDVDDGAGAPAPSTDDWPFLYTNPAGQPLVYGLSLGLIVLFGAALTVGLMRGGAAGDRLRPDPQMFFLGAGFLLVETKALVELSLLFGSTWIVNTLVFAGIFVMVLAANVAVALGAGRRIRTAAVLLAASLLAWYVIPRAAFNDLALPVRAVAGTGLAVLPILFAGVIFSASFSRRAAPDVAFGFNLLGAMVGGALEAVSLVTGLRALTLLALALYGLAWLTAPRDRGPAI